MACELDVEVDTIVTASGGSSSEAAAASPECIDAHRNSSGENHHHNAAVKKRRKRTSITSYQLKKLEHLFKMEQWPNRETKERLADEIGMSAQFVNIWFQNKRARIKKESQDEAEQSPRSILKHSSSPKPSTSSTRSNDAAKETDLPVASTPTNESCSQSTIIGRTAGIKDITEETDRSTPAPTNNIKPISAVENKDVGLTVPNEIDDQHDVPSTVSLFQCLVDMMAVEEGILSSVHQPRFNDAVNDALYGIYLKDGSILTYSCANGLEFV